METSIWLSKKTCFSSPDHSDFLCLIDFPFLIMHISFPNHTHCNIDELVMWTADNNNE